jgi:hypothetical protein
MIMETAIIKDILVQDSAERKEFIESTFDYWFSDHQHVRSPFPEFMREELKLVATEKFNTWAGSVAANKIKGLNEEIIAEKLEEIIFEAALLLTKDEDEKISIRYPFLPRTGDIISVKGVEDTVADSEVVKREIVKEKKTAYLKVYFVNLSSKAQWDTKFELPE